MSNYEQLVASRTGDDALTARMRLEELQHFFELIVTSKRSQVPSKWVDEAWHALLEDDSLYREYLSQSGLPYVRHVPGASSPEAYEATRRAILSRADASALAWPSGDAADCEGCSGDAGDHD